MNGRESGPSSLDRPALRTFALGLLGLVVAASLLNGLHLPVAGFQIRPEHVVAPAVLVALAATQIARRATVIRLDAFSVLAVGWICVNALSSWLFAPRPTESFVHVARFGFLVAAFLTVANLPLPRGASDWARAVRLWLALGLVTLAYGIVTWILARHFSIWLPGAVQEPGLVGVGIRGLQVERNLFGICAATGMVVAAYALIAQHRLRRAALASTAFLVVACLVAGVTVVVSLTRSAWVALILVAPTTYLALGPRRPMNADRTLLQLAVFLPLLLGALILSTRMLPTSGSANTEAGTTNPGPALSGAVKPDGAPLPVATTPSASNAIAATPRAEVTAAPKAKIPAAPKAKIPAAPKAEVPAAPKAEVPVEPKAEIPMAPVAVEDRLSTFANLQDDFTVANRIQDAKWAVADWLRSPFLGHGTGSFFQIHGSRLGTEAWISNIVLHTMVDTGLVGLAIQLTLFGLIAWRGWRAAAAATEPALQIGLRAMTAGLIVMAIAYQVTDGTWMAIFWIHIGLMVNGIYAATDGDRPSPRIIG